MEIGGFGDVELQHLAVFLAQARQCRAFRRFLGDQRQDRARDRLFQIGADGVDVGLAPALDPVDNDQAAAVCGKQAECVAGADGVLTARRIRCEHLDRLVSKARPKAGERANMLRPVGSREQIDRKQRFSGHRPQNSQRVVRTESRAPSDSSTMRPSSSVR